MRGKVCPNQIRLKDLRITPAYAGKSHYDLYRFFFTWDHPRVCGEKKSAISPSYVKYGSPPRMRGKADRQGQAVGLYRITPAYAGKSVLLSINVAAQQDHPRVCGEKLMLCHRLRPGRGSPPRMRGKVDANYSILHAVGITPAYAGKRPLAG